MRAYLHKLGDDPSLDTLVFGPDINPELHLPVVGAVNAFPLPSTSLVLGVQSGSPKELDSFWVNDTRDPGGARWRKVIDHTDEVLFEFSSQKHRVLFRYSAERSQRTHGGRTGDFSDTVRWTKAKTADVLTMAPHRR
jgi:hypothetical protein